MHACLSIKKKKSCRNSLIYKTIIRSIFRYDTGVRTIRKKKIKVTMIDILKVLIENV